MAGDHPHRIVQILDKKSPAPSSITVTAAVAAAFARAAFVNRKREIALSWLSLFIGLLASDDAISLWLREYFKLTGHELQPLLEQHHLALPSFDALRSEGPPLALLIEPLLCGDSVWLLLKKAEFARNQTADPSAAIDVHHIVSGLISVPDDEQTGLPGPSLDVRNSGPAFVSEVTQLYPTEVRFWEQWLSDLTVKSSAERTNATESDNLDAVRRRRAMHDEQPPTSNRSGQPGSSLRLEEVQFTLYSPKVIQPGTWHPLLAFMHLDDRMPFVPRDVPSQIEEVRTRAARSLGDALPGFLDKTSDATQRVPHDSDIVMVPSFEHIEFRPRSCTFTWTGEVHEERFKLKARDHSRGGITNGHFNVYLGGTLLIAQLTMEIRIDESVPAVTERQTSVTVTPYRKIFPSYSRKDDEIVRQFERFQAALGDSYLRDVTHLRAGELWEPAIERLITEADVFQLFWSWNAMRSEQVQLEWTYALGLGRPAFVRPTYWEDPLPQAAGLPPEQLRRIHFHRLHWPGMKYSGTDVRVPTDDLAVSYEPPPGGEVDPLELLGPKRPPIPGVPRAGDLAGAPVINDITLRR